VFDFNTGFSHTVNFNGVTSSTSWQPSVVEVPRTLTADLTTVTVSWTVVANATGDNSKPEVAILVDKVAIDYGGAPLPAPPTQTSGDQGTACDTCHQFGPMDDNLDANGHPTAAADPSQYVYASTGDHIAHGVGDPESWSTGEPTAANATVPPFTYPCSACHGDISGYLNGHTNGVKDLSSNSIGSIGATSDNGTWNSSTGRCSNVNCHNNTDSPRWGIDDAACNACHLTPPISGSHNEHYSAKVWGTPDTNGTYCAQCHVDNTTSHSDVTDSTIEMSGSLGWGSNTCSSTPDGCHNGSTTPTWGAGSISCTDCHTPGGANTGNQANPVSGLHNMSATGVTIHDNTLNGTATDCLPCHVEANISGHQDGSNGGDPPNYTGSAVGIASTLYTDAGGTGVTRGSCLSTTDLSGCHSDGGNWRRLWSTDADVDISANPNPGQAVCNVCHGQYSTLTNSTGWNEGTVHYRSGSGAAEDKGIIHTDPDPDQCEDCHAYDSAATHNSNDMIDFSDGGGTYTATLNTDRWYCATCHNGHLSEDPADTTKHTFYDSLAFPNSKNSVTGASVPEGGCDGCHGDGAGIYWPQDAGDNPASENDAGRHAVHITALQQAGTYSTSDGDQKAMCEYCHAAVTSDYDHMSSLPAEVFATTVGGSPATFAKQIWDGTDDINTTASYDRASDTCAGIDCHNEKTTAANFSWYAASTTACTMCHTPGGSGANPTTGLHNVTPSVSGERHDDSLGSGCGECHTMPAIGPASTHINGTFVSDSSSNNDRGITRTNMTWTDGATNTGTCTGTGLLGCHLDGGAWTRLWSTTASNTDGSQCKNCHGTFDQGWATGITVDHTQDYNGDSTSNELYQNHDNGDSSTTQYNQCQTCHVYNNSDVGSAYFKAGETDNLGWLPSGTSTNHGDGAIDINNATGYGSGSCSSNCHSESGSHTMQTSSIFNDAGVNGPSPPCTGCHTGLASSGAFAVGPSSPHANGSPGYSTCESCHFSDHSTQDSGTVLISNNTSMGINYTGKTGDPGIRIIASGGASTEAEACWNCHNSLATKVSEWYLNNAYDTGIELDNYKPGTLSTVNWLTGTWTSTNFSSIKSGLTIRSTHDVGDVSSYPVAANNMTNTDKASATSSFACSWCHDVHGIMDKATTGPYPVQRFTPSTTGGAGSWSASTKVYLRGKYWASPYWEDGPPTTTNYAVGKSWGTESPGVGPAHASGHQGQTTTQAYDNPIYAKVAGPHIDENAFGVGSGSGGGYFGVNTSKTLSTSIPALQATPPVNYDTEANVLCLKCHGNLSSGTTPTIKSLWPGHQAVKSNDSASYWDLMKPEMAINQHYQYHNMEDGTPDDANLGYAGDISTGGYGSGGYYNWTVDLFSQVGTPSDTGVVSWTEMKNMSGNGTYKQKYHNFTCSKCHSPHASANARLMITNCFNRDGVGGASYNTFNERDGATWGRIVGSQSASATANIEGFTYPVAQSAFRDVADTWRSDEGHTRAVHCHNNLANGANGTTIWQAVE
jgi:predicted CxxxxCH...CXXCH cytochrome family protein